jgi:hypothetical protein
MLEPNTHDQRFYAAILEELKALRKLVEGLRAPPKPPTKPRTKKEVAKNGIPNKTA